MPALKLETGGLLLDSTVRTLCDIYWNLGYIKLLASLRISAHLLRFLLETVKSFSSNHFLYYLSVLDRAGKVVCGTASKLRSYVKGETNHLNHLSKLGMHLLIYWNHNCFSISLDGAVGSSNFCEDDQQIGMLKAVKRDKLLWFDKCPHQTSCRVANKQCFVTGTKLPL